MLRTCQKGFDRKEVARNISADLLTDFTLLKIIKGNDELNFQLT